MLASQLYAHSQGYRCEGPLECHYCGGPCDRRWTHKEPPPIPFVRTPRSVKKPNSLYVCLGCKLWYRKGTTITFLDGSYRDGGITDNYSWIITSNESKALNTELFIEENKAKLYDMLLDPPDKFCLSLIKEGNRNLIQLAQVNNPIKITETSELAFTLNNVVYKYTTQQLRMALEEDEDRRKKAIVDVETEVQGKEPGVFALLNFLGGYDIPNRKRKVKKS